MQKIKSDLRKDLIKKRRLIRGKENKGREVFKQLCSMDIFKDTKDLYIYVSMADEVDTIGIIEYAFRVGKRVFTPRVCPKKNTMHFYRIRTFADLEKGHFGVLEPCTEEVQEVKGGICIVPGIAFDRQLFRIGYGKGYYDRFIDIGKPDGMVLAGLCYEEMVLDSLPIEKFDRPVDILITDEKVTFRNGGRLL